MVVAVGNISRKIQESMLYYDINKAFRPMSKTGGLWAGSPQTYFVWFAVFK